MSLSDKILSIKVTRSDALTMAHGLATLSDISEEVYLKEALEDANTIILNELLPKIDDALRHAENLRKEKP